MKRITTILLIGIMALIGTGVTAQVNYGFWISTEGAGVHISNRHLPPPPPRFGPRLHHHRYHKPKPPKKHRKHYKKIKKAKRAHKYYKKHHRHHDD
ncbi:MAG: hypothetical protein NC338_02825 [Firmicutes bacterium]|nr:hypothetical protein [Bacillota bacterium]MCM1400876.1 hypothetical protein [Bacteroides sp.]MCM1476629.1 hypothetical protein [Bacteroides sp.]